MISVQVLREFYSAVRRQPRPLSDKDAEAAVGRLAGFSPVSEDAGMVLGAVRRTGETGVSFWDALIVEGMRVVNPFLESAG